MNLRLTKNRFILLGLTLIFSSGVSAADPAGETVTTATTEAEVENPPIPSEDNSEDPSEQDQSVAKYQEKIHKFEVDYGIYDSRLIENLLGLGLVYQQNEQHGQALKAFNRALQVKRINEGLHDFSQLPLLERIIESNIASENWTNLDQNYHQLLWIHRRNYGEGDPRLLPFIDKVGRWKIKAYSNNLLDGNRISFLKDSEKLYRDTVIILEKQFGAYDQLLIIPLYGKAASNYQLAVEVMKKPLSDFEGTADRTREREDCTVIITPTGRRSVCRTVTEPDPNYLISKQRDKDSAIAHRFSQAGSALQQIIKIHDANSDLPPESLAQALAHYGDWNLLDNRKRTALENYKRAYKLLADSGDEEKTINKLFGRPKSIPALKLSLPNVEKQLTSDTGSKGVAKQSAPDTGRKYVIISYKVSRHGRPRNIKIIESNPPDAIPSRRNAKRMIKESMYRPQFENGEPIDSQEIKIRIVE